MISCRIPLRLLAALFLVCLSACQLSAQPVRKGIEPPTGHIQILTVYAEGEQVYVSRAAADGAGRFEWALLEPKAELCDENGKHVGRHRKGPVWEVAGCKVTGRKLQEQPAAGTIPWLLLEVIQCRGPEHGLLRNATFVQRIYTSGGVALGEAPAKAGLKRGVHYFATYVFWGHGEDIHAKGK